MNGAVLFDLDGTVMDTTVAITKSLSEMAGSFGVIQPESLLCSQIGRPLDQIVDTLLPGMTDANRELAKDRFHSSFAAQTLADARRLIHPGTLRLIEYLHRNDLAVAIVTSEITTSAFEQLSAEGIDRSFDAVVCHDMARFGKPHPDLALVAAQQLTVEPRSCIVIGDSRDDIAMGLAADMSAIGVDWGVADAKALIEAGASVVVSDVDALTQEISRLLLGTGGSS